MLSVKANLEDAEDPMPVTKEAILAILTEHPLLSYFGWGVYNDNNARSAKAKVELKELRAQLLEDAAIAQIERCCNWLAPIQKTKNCNPECDSYGLKHSVERHHRKDPAVKSWYISNGSFIVAALLSGFKQKRDDRGMGPNSYFNMSQADLRRRKKTQISGDPNELAK